MIDRNALYGVESVYYFCHLLGGRSLGLISEYPPLFYMKNLDEFIKRIKVSEISALISNLEIDRELFSEMDETDELKAHFRKRIELFVLELRIRKYYEEEAIPLDSALKVVALRKKNYIELLKCQIEFGENISIWERVIRSLENENKEEIILCAVKNSNIIIDVKTLLSEEAHFSYKNLSCIEGFKPEYSEISELSHLFWNYILSQGNIFKLFREIGSAILQFFDRQKLQKSVDAGMIYNKWNEKSLLQNYIHRVEVEKKFIDLHIEVLISNPITESHYWYVFNLTQKEIVLRLGDEGFSFDLTEPFLNVNIYNDYNKILYDNHFDTAKIQAITSKFIESFTYPLPTTEYNVNMEEGFIHVIEFNFTVIDCKPKYDIYK